MPSSYNSPILGPSLHHDADEAGHPWHTPHEAGSFTQAVHDALPGPHHSSVNDHANTSTAHGWHGVHYDHAADPHHAEVHDHEGIYASVGHPHASYASLTHLHEGAYSSVGHQHAGPTTAKVTAQQVVSVVAYTDIACLAFAAASATTYAYSFWIRWRTNVSTNGAAFAMNAPAGASLAYTVEVMRSSTGVFGPTSTAFFRTADAMTPLAAVPFASTEDAFARIEGTAYVSATAGTIAARVRSETSVGTAPITIERGTWGMWF